MAQAETDRVPETQISVIPPMELVNLQNAIAETERECAVLATLEDKINKIEVKDAASYAELGQYVAQASAVKKIPEFNLGKFVVMARRVKDWLSTEVNKHANRAEVIIARGKAKMGDYKRRETQLAQEEEKRINAEKQRIANKLAETDRKAREKEIAKQSKAGEISKSEANKQRKQADQDAEATKNNVPQVSVKPSVPTVSGVPMRTNWKFEVVDAARLPRTFLCPDLVAIGSEVRGIKDKERAEKSIPGIRVWSE